MGHTRSAAVCSTGSDHRQRRFLTISGRSGIRGNHCMTCKEFSTGKMIHQSLIYFWSATRTSGLSLIFPAREVCSRGVIVTEGSVWGYYPIIVQKWRRGRVLVLCYTGRQSASANEHVRISQEDYRSAGSAYVPQLTLIEHDSDVVRRVGERRVGRSQTTRIHCTVVLVHTVTVRNTAGT